MFEYTLAGFTGTFFSYWVVFTCGSCIGNCSLTPDDLRQDIKYIKRKVDVIMPSNHIIR